MGKPGVQQRQTMALRDDACADLMDVGPQTTLVLRIGAPYVRQHLCLEPSHELSLVRWRSCAECGSQDAQTLEEDRGQGEVGNGVAGHDGEESHPSVFREGGRVLLPVVLRWHIILVRHQIKTIECD